MQHQPGIGTTRTDRPGSEPVDIEPLVRKLERFAAFSHEEKRLLAGAVIRTKTLLPNEDLVRDGQEPTECHVVLDGMLCRYKLLPEGKRRSSDFRSPATLRPRQSPPGTHRLQRRGAELGQGCGALAWRPSTID